ncbi:hypothetical protein CGRA01v4_09913 [Colletotrichum graminicola]|uniref:Uncharacterized protein n=1 Tax=Colletotrichum graminicola (strain M1.001 / M2 / FGSC 10212) TaxID=645133 RepID=E3QHN9_COLGM|nr:uncharacterized protein GLRG_05521 [Colletotrichum graminicola M1.001]EFQ30377.1 hypothetical protein GLRG_05521 [Colletotrichum graminicola M1.001]WDK18628.1 hypothetical protein CGRA01v4_09913 [Colletotrichum graminicola]
MAQDPLVDTQNSLDAVLESVFKQFAPQAGSNGDASWYSQCAGRVLNGWNEEKEANITHETRSRIISGIVIGINGTRFNGSTNDIITSDDVWGISSGLCKEFCGRGELDMITSFNRLASGSTNYLLPWLALTAQLPYETGSTEANLIGVCIGLGSPLLMTFSLMMTILNKRWIRKRFKELAASCEGDGFDKMKTRIKSARVIADESGQAPTRLLQTDGWLARLVVLDTNTTWWSEAANSLKSTRRGTTLSLIAQLVVAVIAWVFTVTGSLKQKVGDTEEALVLSSGSLWIWLVPVIIGWVLVGTQNKKGTIQEAIRRANGRISVENKETGIEVVDDVEHPALADPTTRFVNAPSSPTRTNQPEMRLRMFSVAGCQRQQGPVYNYARSITWLNFADRLYMAFRAASDQMKKQREILSQPCITNDDYVKVSADCGLAPNVSTHANGSAGHHQQPPATQGPPSHVLVEYTSLSEMSPPAMSAFWRHVAWSMLVALVLQWGTTGWAIYISYETVVKGLGCRSGSYVIYGVLATASCAAMLFSAWVSHFTMRAYQYTHRTTGYLQFCGAVAVVTRLLGQFLLVSNTIWLLAISIFELIGFFDSCYCSGTELSKRLEYGWILLFKNADALKADAQEAWKTGIGMGFVTNFLAVMIFYLASRQGNE